MVNNTKSSSIDSSIVAGPCNPRRQIQFYLKTSIRILNVVNRTTSVTSLLISQVYYWVKVNAVQTVK